MWIMLRIAVGSPIPNPPRTRCRSFISTIWWRIRSTRLLKSGTTLRSRLSVPMANIWSSVQTVISIRCMDRWSGTTSICVPVESISLRSIRRCRPPSCLKMLLSMRRMSPKRLWLMVRQRVKNRPTVTRKMQRKTVRWRSIRKICMHVSSNYRWMLIVITISIVMESESGIM